MKKVYLLCCVLLLNLSLFSQVQSVNLITYYGCNGATLVPFVIWSGTPRPVTVNFERQGAAGTWFNVVSQVYDAQASYIVVSPTDISSATNYRIRAVDMTTLQEYFSAGVVVNPALWNVNRGIPFFTAIAGWGTNCSNNDNNIAVSINSTTNGRPPYRVEYKPSTQPNYLVAGETNGFMYITGILPGTVYHVRIVDYCGNVTPLQSAVLGFSANAGLMQNATTCDNGRIQVTGIGGIAPYEYGIGKIRADMGGSILPDFEYRSVNTFDSLAPGDYYVRLRDQCGNLSGTGFIRLGGGFPRFTSARSIPAGDSCSRNLTVTVNTGDGPFEYGIRYMLDNQYSWQTSNVFTNLTREGVYYLRVKDKCGQLSDSVLDNIGTIPKPIIDSVRNSSLPGCEQNIKVYASGGYKPYNYSRDMFNWKTTDTFNNLLPGIYYLWVRDRCGRISPYLIDTISVKELTLHINSGMDSCGASTAFLSVDSVTNGLAPFQYAIRNMAAQGNTYSPFVSDSIFRGLAPGLYSIWVKDACFAEKIVDSIVVGSGFTYDYELTPNIGCSPFLTINLHGGRQTPFTYFITNGIHKRKIVTNDSIFVLTDLPNGTYTITITDACGDTATAVLPNPQISLSGTPQITYEVQYLNGCSEANIIIHGAPAGSLYQLWHPSGPFFESSDSVFRSADYNIISGKYNMVAHHSNFCGNTYYYGDTVTVALTGTLLTGTVDPNLPDSFCIYNNNSVRLTDFLLDEFPGGSWASTAIQGFDPVTGLFTPSLAGVGDYEFTYSILDSCGMLHETSVFLSVAFEACAIRTIAGDYHSSTQPEGCPPVSVGFDWIDFTDEHGNLLFSLNPLGRDLMSVCAGVRIVDGNGSSLRSTVIDGKINYFLDRNFYIEVANPSDNSPVLVRLYITNEEMDNMLNFLHNNGYPLAGPADIRILQKSGDDVDLQVINEGVLDPARFVIITPTMSQNANGWIMQFEVFNFSEFNPHFIGASTNLPLRLIDFTGTNRQGANRLQWKTAEEINTAHFDLERSNDGNNFSAIARIHAAGNSVSEKTYTRDDLQPLPGNNFYRLKMVDIDGKYTYSKTILLRSEKITGLKITPNPARDHLYVSIPGNIKAMAIRIYDATGRLLYQERLNGNQLQKVQTGHLRNGWYLLELQTATGSMREAFLKQ
jgi:hypothetical protein